METDQHSPACGYFTGNPDDIYIYIYLVYSTHGTMVGKTWNGMARHGMA